VSPAQEREDTLAHLRAMLGGRRNELFGCPLLD
jgi:hypothetical protein